MAAPATCSCGCMPWPAGRKNGDASAMATSPSCGAACAAGIAAAEAANGPLPDRVTALCPACPSAAPEAWEPPLGAGASAAVAGDTDAEVGCDGGEAPNGCGVWRAAVGDPRKWGRCGSGGKAGDEPSVALGMPRRLAPPARLPLLACMSCSDSVLCTLPLCSMRLDRRGMLPPSISSMLPAQAHQGNRHTRHSQLPPPYM
jgi:hypothetical protein